MADASAAGSEVTLAGQRIWPGPGHDALEPAVIDRVSWRTTLERALRGGSSFRLSSSARRDDPGAGRWAAWGGARTSRFDGKDGGLGVDSEVTTWTMGVDRERGGVLAGVALSHSAGGGALDVPVSVRRTVPP